MNPINWTEIRSRVILDPTIINLNTGSFGPLPRSVFERVTELRYQLAAEPTDFFVRRVPPLLWHARERFAHFLGCSPNRLLFSTNVSSAINLVASSLRLHSPGEVLLTDHEYGAMHWCWERAAQRQRLSFRTFRLPTKTENAQEIVDAFAAAITSKTRLAFFSHILSPTGLVLPVQEMCRVARAAGVLTVVDGAHAAAMLPLNVDQVGADFYAGNAHKWLLAPTGSGFLVLGKGNEDRLQPLEVSWGYHFPRTRIDKPDEFGSTPRLRFLEFEGTRDVCPWLVVPDAIDFQSEIGWAAIRARIAALGSYARQRMAETIALAPATPRSLCGALTAFELPPGIDPARLRQAIWKHRIEVPIVERPDMLIIRLSAHFYNNENEIDSLLSILPEAILQSRTE